MIPFGFFTRTAPAPAPVVHIHPGGTANAYCGEVLTAPGAVDWTQAEEEAARQMARAPVPLHQPRWTSAWTRGACPAGLAHAARPRMACA